MLSPALETAASRFGSVLRSPWLRPLNDLDAIDDLAATLATTWSSRRIRARVVDAIRETADVRTLVLRPNRLWRGHRAGQHVLVDAEVDGRRVSRTFTISSPPRPDGTIAITVKRRPQGKLSVWWNERATRGEVVTLGAPAGDFVLPAAPRGRIVMVSAGSGITPVMAMLRDLEARAHATPVLFIHSARRLEDVIFRGELEGLARRRSCFDLKLHLSEAGSRLDASSLARYARAAGDDLALVCGPGAFMEAVRAAWCDAGAEGRLRFEHFGLPSALISAAAEAASQPVHANRSGLSFVAPGTSSLLAAAEAAGLAPAYGCRMGICHTCKCRKVAGVVVDLRTGRTSEEPGEMIQLCVSAARSPLTLDL